MTTYCLCYSRARDAWVDIAGYPEGPYGPEDFEQGHWSFDEDEKCATPYDEKTAKHIQATSPALGIVFTKVTT